MEDQPDERAGEQAGASPLEKWEPIFRASLVLEERMGVAEGTLMRLFDDENDWSVLVRSTVFVQAAVAHAVAHTLGRPELEDYFGAMNLSGRHGGLLTLARRLQVVDEVDIAFIDALSELRNRFAHKLQNINRTIPEFIETLPKHEFRKIVGGLMYAADAREQLDAYSEDAKVRNLVRQLATMGLMQLCAKLGQTATDAELRNARAAITDAQDSARAAMLNPLSFAGQTWVPLGRGQPKFDDRS